MTVERSRRHQNAAFPSAPETPIMPEIHRDLMVVIPQITSSKRFTNISSNTWKIVIGGRDFRLTCANNLSRLRLWAYDDGLRWNIQMRLVWRDAFGVDAFDSNSLNNLTVVAAHGDVAEIMNDLVALRLAA